MTPSTLAAALVATLVGFGGTLAIIIAAAQNIGATPTEVTSWIVALCLGIGVFSIGLSLRHRMPIVGAWSLAGAVLLAGLPPGTTMPAATGAFLVLAVLTLGAGAVPALGRLVAALPASLGAAMLAGLILRFATGLFTAAQTEPWLVLPLLAAFAAARLVHAASAPIVVLLLGLPLAAALGHPMPPIAITAPTLHWVTPTFGPAMIGLGLPLFLITMATQQVSGTAVLTASGYTPPVRSIWLASGVLTLLLAPFGGFSINTASVTAAICTGPDAHPDPAQRYHAGWIYGAAYLVLALCGASLATILAALPPVLVATVAGTALLAPMTNALAAAMHVPHQRFPATLAFVVTASGYTAFGLGGAIWGLAAGIAVLALDSLASRRRHHRHPQPQ